MKARAEFRDRPDTEVAVLDALVDRNEEGMTVLELRAHADIDIDDLEEALGNLKRDDLIAATEEGNRTLITVDENVVPTGEEPEPEPSFIDQLRDRLGL
ncbi:MAG: DUF6432 family protein [Halobacteriaceae archaeon]